MARSASKMALPLQPACTAGPAENCPAPGGTGAPQLTLQTIDTVHSFEALETEWNALFERAAGPHQVFAQFNWLWHWQRHYLISAAQHAKTTLAIVTGRIDGRLAMVLPLTIERTLGLSRVGWMGQPVSQYGDVLAEDGEFADTLIGSALERMSTLGADLVHLRKIRGDSRLIPWLAALGTEAFDRQEAPCIDLGGGGNFAQLLQRYPAKDRKNRRRHRRRLAELGSVGFKRIGSGEEAAALARKAVGLKRHQLQSRGRISRTFDSACIEEFMAAACGPDRPAGAALSWLTLDGMPIAYNICFNAGQICAAHITVYDPAYERFSPGSLLLEDVLSAALADGVQVFDMLAPAARYKMDWASRTVEIADHALPLTILGRGYVSTYLMKIRPRLRRWLEQLPVGVGRLLTTAGW